MATTHIRAFEAADLGSLVGKRSRLDSVQVPVDRETLFAHHAACPSCGAYVRQLTRLRQRPLAVELVAGYCSVCCTTTTFAPGAGGVRCTAS